MHNFTGFGVDQLRDNCLETYWQSDGPQPHLVNIQFRKKTTIQDVCLYADYKLDESYTPNRYCLFILTTNFIQQQLSFSYLLIHCNILSTMYCFL